MLNMETIIIAARALGGPVETVGVGVYYPTYGRDNHPYGNFFGITHVHTHDAQTHLRGRENGPILAQNPRKMDEKLKDWFQRLEEMRNEIASQVMPRLIRSQILTAQTSIVSASLELHEAIEILEDK